MSSGVRLARITLQSDFFRHPSGTGVDITKLGVLENIVQSVCIRMTKTANKALEFCVCKEALLKNIPADGKVAEESPHQRRPIRTDVYRLILNVVEVDTYIAHVRQ